MAQNVRAENGVQNGNSLHGSPEFPPDYRRSQQLSPKLPSTSLKILIMLILLAITAGCGKAPSVGNTIGVMSLSTADGTLSGFSAIGNEQKSGYETGLGAVSTKFTIKDINESSAQSDIQKTILGMAEDPQNPIVAMLGASSNIATSRAAALVNFFNVPMVVPSAYGDNLFPSNNLWAFRLSAPGSAYATNIFGNILTKANSGSDATSQVEYPGLKIAILYEQNTFGESAAVAAAKAAMAQSIKIGLYDKFPVQSPDPDTINKLMDQAKRNKVQLVYVISSDPAVAKMLVQAFRAKFDPATMPIIVGQAGGFASLDFLNAPEAQGVFVFRQKIDASACPAEVKSIYQAQSYASVYLLDQAVTQAQNSLKANPSKWLSAQPDLSAQSVTLREKVRDILKDTNLNLPCIGMVAFDNTGQNKLLHIELISVNQGKTLTNQVDAFSSALILRLKRDSLQ